jgi:hypothetical protein
MKGCGVAKTQSIELMMGVDRVRTKKVRIFLPATLPAPSSLSTGPTNRIASQFQQTPRSFRKTSPADRSMENKTGTEAALREAGTTRGSEVY